MIVPGALPWLHSMVTIVALPDLGDSHWDSEFLSRATLFNSRPNVPWQDALDPGGSTTQTGVSAKR
jgi:hypothetical protein